VGVACSKQVSWALVHVQVCHAMTGVCRLIDVAFGTLYELVKIAFIIARKEMM